MKPGISLFIGAIIWLLLGAGGFFSSAFSLIWFLSGITALLIIIIDAVFLLFMIDTLKIERSINTSLALGEQSVVKLKIERSNRGFLAAKIKLFDIYPDSMLCQVFPVVLDKKGLKNSTLLFQRKTESSDSFLLFEYFVTPMQRGEW